MKLRAVFIILAVVLIPLAMASDTQHRVKVCVYTDENSSELENEFKSLFQRELRLLGDVDIVNITDDWMFLFQFNIIEPKLSDGSKMGLLAIAHCLSASIPKSNFKSYNFKGIEKPVYLPLWMGTSFYNKDNLLQFAILFAGNFDNSLEKKLAPFLF